MRKTSKWTALLCVVIAVPAVAAAEDADASFRSCRSLQDDAKRLACYDREVDLLGKPSQPGGATPAAPALTPEERFGRSGAMNREESDRKVQETRELGELQATVSEIWTRADGLMVLTLDNGQIWKQVRPDTQFRLKQGEKVEIRPAALGSYLLSGESNRSTRVSRVK